jgi:hypothetical protein
MEFLKKRRARLTPMRSYSFALTVKVAERGGGAGDVTWCGGGGVAERVARRDGGGATASSGSGDGTDLGGQLLGW